MEVVTIAPSAELTVTYYAPSIQPGDLPEKVPHDFPSLYPLLVFREPRSLMITL